MTRSRTQHVGHMINKTHTLVQWSQCAILRTTGTWYQVPGTLRLVHMRLIRWNNNMRPLGSRLFSGGRTCLALGAGTAALPVYRVFLWRRERVRDITYRTEVTFGPMDFDKTYMKYPRRWNAAIKSGANITTGCSIFPHLFWLRSTFFGSNEKRPVNHLINI